MTRSYLERSWRWLYLHIIDNLLYNYKYCGAELALDIWTLKIYFASRLTWRYRVKFINANAFQRAVASVKNTTTYVASLFSPVPVTVAV